MGHLPRGVAAAAEMLHSSFNSSIRLIEFMIQVAGHRLTRQVSTYMVGHLLSTDTDLRGPTAYSWHTPLLEELPRRPCPAIAFR
jgi:hypothetical protein